MEKKSKPRSEIKTDTQPTEDEEKLRSRRPRKDQSRRNNQIKIVSRCEINKPV